MALRKDDLVPVAADIGCWHATEYLGEQSLCLACPFPECVFDKPEKLQYLKNGRMREDIIRQFSQGSSVKELASLYGVSIVTVYSALRCPACRTPINNIASRKRIPIRRAKEKEDNGRGD